MRTFWNISKIALVIAGILLVVFSRFYQLGTTPPGIALDEANYGYDAYSILHTGRDMWGQLGISLKSLGEYKPTGLTFTLLPLIKLFGLSTFTTRLPSAIYGLFTVVVAYYLINLLIKDRAIAYVGAIILGLSPWHLGLSRQYYESVSGLFFIASSIYFQIKYIRDPKNIKNIIIAAVLASCAGYYYQVLRYIGPGLIGLSITTSNLPKWNKVLKMGMITAAAWAIVSAPYLIDMFGSRGLMRLQQENTMHEYGNVLVITEKRELCYLTTGKNLLMSKICFAWWNKPGEKLLQIGKTYLELLSPSYLFSENMQADTISKGNGAYLEITVIFYLIGIYYLIKNISKKEHIYILIAYLLSVIPIAAGYTTGIQRNVVGLFLVCIISSYGMYFAKEVLIKNLKLPSRTIVIILFSLIFLWTQSRYLANYFLAYTKMTPEVWHSDTPELMTWLSQNRQGRQIVFFDFPYGTLYYSFFDKLYPVKFQADSKWSEPDKLGALNIVGMTGITSSGSDLFDPICAHKDKTTPSSLLVITGSRAGWERGLVKQTRNFRGIHILHEIYDSKTLYDLGMCGK